MSKTLKALLVALIIITFSLNLYNVQATSDDYDSSQYISEETTDVYNTVGTSDENENVVKENASDASLQTLTPSSVTSVSSKDNYNNANLTLNNILCIILISIGVLLILLSIAILIRLKK